MSEDLRKIVQETQPDGLMPPVTMTCMAGQIICAQGTPANQAFYIETGLAEVIVEEDGHSVKLAEIGPGQVFGEMGVLEREMRMATVRAVETSKITVMSREELEQRIEMVGDPVVKALINGLAKRLRATSAGQVRYYKNLVEFQDRVMGLMNKANDGIDRSRRDEFTAEMTPLLDRVEATLDKYKKT